VTPATSTSTPRMPVQFSINARSSRRQDSFLMGALRGAGSGNGAGFRVGGAPGACGVKADAGESLRGGSTGAAGEGVAEEGGGGA
jgi:hypothetical protein